MATLVLHINREALHHGAEIALLLDLYTHTGGSRMTTPTIQIASTRPTRTCSTASGPPPSATRSRTTTTRSSSIVAAGYATLDDTIEIDGRLAWKIAAACRDPAGTGPRLLFQQVPEPKTVKDRVHLDLQRPAGRRRSARPRSPG